MNELEINQSKKIYKQSSHISFSLINIIENKNLGVTRESVWKQSWNFPISTITYLLKTRPHWITRTGKTSQFFFFSLNKGASGLHNVLERNETFN